MRLSTETSNLNELNAQLANRGNITWELADFMGNASTYASIVRVCFQRLRDSCVDLLHSSESTSCPFDSGVIPIV